MVERYALENDEMTPGLRDQLIRVYFYGTRYHPPRNRDRFDEIYSWIQGLDPTALPESPRHLRLVSKMIGYRTAESVVITYRRLKKVLRLL
jgi:hypothetical protein